MNYFVTFRFARSYSALGKAQINLAFRSFFHNFAPKYNMYAKEMEKNLVIFAVAALLFSSCSGKLSELTSEYFRVAPNPMVAEAGQVDVTINGVFPEKYMDKQAVVTVVPELRYQKNGVLQTKRGLPATFQGEKVQGNEQIISYRLGGRYSMKTGFAYEDAMHKSELFLTFDARIGKKQMEVPAVKVADGVIATSELYRQTLATVQPAVAPDAFQRVVSQKQQAVVRFLIQQAELRKSELKNNSVQEFVALLKRISSHGDKQNLNNAEDFVQQQKEDNAEDSVEANYTALDWEGFQQLVAASDIQDKDVLLRVLSMYKAPKERQRQIKNLSEGFRELADGILPELRRARMTINYETIGRDDDEIFAQYKQDAGKLSVEELLYAASITDPKSNQAKMLKMTTRLYPQDGRAYNNLAALAYQQGNYDDARQYLEQALQCGGRCPEAKANLGLLALVAGTISEAEQYMGQAAGAKGLEEALGNLHLAQGNYALAEQDFRGIDSNSAALAQILNKNYEQAAKTLKNVAQPDGITDYLQAVVNARQGNNEAAAAFLRTAIQKDPLLKAYADNDLELEKVKR